MRYAIFFFFGCFASSVDSNIFGQLLKIPNHELLLLLEEFKKYPGIIIFFRCPLFFYSSHFFQSIIVADVARGQRSRQAGVKREVKALSPGCVPDVFPLHDIAGCGSAARDVTAAPTPVIGSKPRAKGKVHPFYTGFSRRGRVCVY